MLSDCVEEEEVEDTDQSYSISGFLFPFTSSLPSKKRQIGLLKKEPTLSKGKRISDGNYGMG